MVVVLLEGLMAQVVTSTNGHLQTSGATDQAVLLLLLRGWRWWRVVAHLLLVVHKVATRSVRTVAGTVEGAA